MSKGRSLQRWIQVQARYADVPGEAGVALRRRHYAPFFLRFGRDVAIEEGCRFFKPERIVLEDDARINIGGLFYGSGGLVIGRHARIGPRCFIHSANHDVTADDPRAFFERGYDYRKTVVGDNTLVSANASILPGTILGHGSFVACGAVVSGAVYPANSRLFGVPARNSPCSPAAPAVEEAPELVFLVPADRPDLADAADLLREVLGLPQAVRMAAGEAVPSTVAAILCFGGAEPAAETTADVWRLVPGQAVLDTKQALSIPGGKPIRLPTQRNLLTRPIVAPGAPAAEKLKDVAYWLHARLFKRSDPLQVAEFREWLTALSLLDWPDAAKEEVLKQLSTRRPGGVKAVASASSVPAAKAIRRWMQQSQSAPDQPEGLLGAQSLLEWLKRLPRFLSIGLRTRDRQFTGKRALSRPVDLVWLAASAPQQQQAELKRLVVELVPHCRTSLQWVSVGLAAHILHMPEVRDQARQELNSASRCPVRGGVLRQLPEQPQLLLSPLYAAWLLLVEMGCRKVPFDLLAFKPRREDLAWRGFPGADGDWALSDGGLVDVGGQRIAEDLLRNWLMLHTAPCTADRCLELTADAYDTAVGRLERIWLSLMTHLLHRNSRPLVRLRPWPAPYRAALSLRYDVDRAVLPGRLWSLIHLQASRANAPIGSWYFRTGDANAEELRQHLARALQEAGVHVETLGEVGAGDGVTHHSAPTSVYWQGDHTTRGLAACGAAYGEFHAAALPTPRRAWLAPVKGEEGFGCGAGLMLTALHFPLEGGTDDHDLTYFDRLLPAFRERLDQGGHAIVGSHPDLDQMPLNILFGRESEALQNVWKTTVAEVVNRWRQVMTPGRIKLVRTAAGSSALLSDQGVADLMVEIVPPGADAAAERNLQLMANIPAPFALS